MGNEIARPTAPEGFIRVAEADYDKAEKKFNDQAAELKRLRFALAQAKEDRLLQEDQMASTLGFPVAATLPIRASSMSSASLGVPCARTSRFRQEQTVMARKSVLRNSRRGTMYPKRSNNNSKSDDDCDAERRTSLTDAFTAFISDHAANPATAQSVVPIMEVVRIFASEGMAVTMPEIRAQLAKLDISREELCMDEFILLYDQLRVAVFEKEAAVRSRSRAASLSGAASRPESEMTIFMGGACNPTTWRFDVAIPAFQAEGIPTTAYYNPQVERWSPELVPIEAAAKADASILLFVITDETRAVGTMIEVSEHASLAKLNGKQIVVVIQDIKPGSTFADGAASAAEIKDLNRGRAYLADVCARHGFVVFQTIESGIDYTVQVYKELQARREIVSKALRAASESVPAPDSDVSPAETTAPRDSLSRCTPFGCDGNDDGNGNGDGAVRAVSLPEIRAESEDAADAE